MFCKSHIFQCCQPIWTLLLKETCWMLLCGWMYYHNVFLCVVYLCVLNGFLWNFLRMTKYQINFSIAYSCCKFYIISKQLELLPLGFAKMVVEGDITILSRCKTYLGFTRSLHCKDALWNRFCVICSSICLSLTFYKDSVLYLCQCYNCKISDWFRIPPVFSNLGLSSTLFHSYVGLW